MTTDHRKIADRLLFPSGNPTPNEHLLAAIHDEQRTQTGLLTDLRGAIDDLAETLRPKGEPCPCGCRRDVERTVSVTIEPDLSDFLDAMQDRINATLADPNVTAALNPGGHVAGPTDVHEAGGCDDCTTEPESVTVTLPRDVAVPGEGWDWRAIAFRVRTTKHYSAALLLDALADALDAANTPDSPTSFPVASEGGDLAPEGGQGAERAADGRVWVDALDLECLLDEVDSRTDPCRKFCGCPRARLRAALDGGQS